MIGMQQGQHSKGKTMMTFAPRTRFLSQPAMDDVLSTKSDVMDIDDDVTKFPTPPPSGHVRSDKVIGVDRHTGLPKLQIEFLPDMDEDELKRKSVSLGRNARMEQKTKHPKSPGRRHKDFQHTPSLESYDKNHWKSKQLKTRSRSVFIKLQKTPPTPHRGLPYIEDSDIQTAPAVSGRDNHFTFQTKGSDRRCSDSKTLGFTRSESELEQDEVADKLPSSLPKHTALTRRSSFLYLSDDDEKSTMLSSKPISRTPSMGSHVGDETYITPFAQILANLHRVRSQFIVLMGLQDEPATAYSHSHSHSSTCQTKLTGEEEQQLALETLEELDWCLKKLETVDSAKSMGIMAQDKFKRILMRELSNLSESGPTGSQVAEWVHTLSNWDHGEQVDRVLDTTALSPSLSNSMQEPTLSASMRHDDWTKLRMHREKSPSPTPHLRINFCEKVPTYGITTPTMNIAKMKEFMDHQIDMWEVDAFYLDTISSGNPLVTASYHIFKRRKFFAEFKISPPTLIAYMTSIQASYKRTNPYHNCVHAADVLMATNYLLNAKPLEGVFTNLEVLAALVAAAIHDVDHPGTSNQFLIYVGHDLAILYNDSSVLENHHLAVAFKTLRDPSCDFLQHMESAQRQVFRKMVIDMVLATDMAKHFMHVGDLKTLLETKKVANDGILVLDKYSDRSEVLQCLLHCADLRNPTLPVELARKWSLRIMEESFLQGDEEKKRGIPLNPLGDREQVCVEKCQVTFLDFFIYPLWETWAELVYPDAQNILDNITKTRDYWQSQIPLSPLTSEADTDEEESTSPDLTSNPGTNSPLSVETNQRKTRLDSSPSLSDRRSSFAAAKKKGLGETAEPESER